MEVCWTQNWFGEWSHDQECGRKRTRKLRTKSRIRGDRGWEQKFKYLVEYCLLYGNSLTNRGKRSFEKRKNQREQGKRQNKTKKQKTSGTHHGKKERKKQQQQQKPCESVRMICDYQDLVLYPVTLCLPQKAISKVCFQAVLCSLRKSVHTEGDCQVLLLWVEYQIPALSVTPL